MGVYVVSDTTGEEKSDSVDERESERVLIERHDPDRVGTWRMGDQIPEPPDGGTVADLPWADDSSDVGEARYLVARLALATETVADLVAELESELPVVATDERVDGDTDSNELDLVLSREPDPEALGNSLAESSAVRGVTIAAFDATAADEYDPEEANRPDGGVAQPARAETDPPPAGLDHAFQQLKREIEPVGYERLVEELDAAEIGLGSEEAADIDALLADLEAEGVGTDDSDATGEDATDEDGAADRTHELEPDSVLSALLAALDEHTLSPAERARFRTALGVDRPASLEARIEHLQQEVDEFAAYADALETILDEDDGPEALGSLQTDVEELSRQVSTVARAVRVLAARLDDNDDRLSHLESSVDRLRDRTDDVETELEAARRWQDRLGTAITGADAK